jgi:hypothetical protein
MATTTSPQIINGAGSASADSACFTIAEDRLEGALAIGRFIDPNMTPREARRLLDQGHYPCWREGRVYVASRAALLNHWREKTTQVKGQSAQIERNKCIRRGRLAIR